jgi:RND family efflux transporter MFP subunit
MTEMGHGRAFVPTQDSAARRRVLQIGAAVILVGLIAAAGFMYRAHRSTVALRQATDAQAPVTVATTRPEPIGGNTDLVLPGSLQANFEAPIYARTSGYLKTWLVDIGAQVKSGQLLGVIESPEVDQQLRQAEADLATAHANQQIADVTATRWKNLRASDSVSKQEADEKISAAAATDAQVQAAEANVRRLRELAGFERIVAPFDGIVTARNTDVGQLISAGGGTGPELFRVADMNHVRLYVRVPQADVAYIQQGLDVQVRLPERPDLNVTGKLDTTSHAIDPSSRTLLAEVIIDNRRRELLPGAYAEVHFQLPAGAPGGSFRLPANVLLFRGDGLHVATVDPQGHVVLQPVTIGRDFGAAVEIVTGVSAGDDVILSPPDSLTTGVTVHVVRPGGNPRAAAAPKVAHS